MGAPHHLQRGQPGGQRRRCRANANRQRDRALAVLRADILLRAVDPPGTSYRLPADHEGDSAGQQRLAGAVRSGSSVVPSSVPPARVPQPAAAGDELQCQAWQWASWSRSVAGRKGHRRRTWSA